MAFEMSVFGKLIQWKSLNSEKHAQNVNYKHCHRSIKHEGVEKKTIDENCLCNRHYFGH